MTFENVESGYKLHGLAVSENGRHVTQLKRLVIVRSILKKPPKGHNLVMSSPCGFGFSSSPEPTSPTSIQTLCEGETEASSPVGIGFSSDNENTMSPQSGMTSNKTCIIVYSVDYT
jgi:hypothetical protein